MTAPGVYTPSQGSRDEKLVEVVARILAKVGLRHALSNDDNEEPNEQDWEGATAAINAIREWEL